jgi:hypothetical protein
LTPDSSITTILLLINGGEGVRGISILAEGIFFSDLKILVIASMDFSITLNSQYPTFTLAHPNN